MEGAKRSPRPRPDPRATAARLRRLTPIRPTLAIVLGSAFDSALVGFDKAVEVPYSRIPGFPGTTVEGHSGKLLMGRFGKAVALVLSGRAHYYEGFGLDEVTLPVRVLAEFGVTALLLTNAAGAINGRFRPGDFMAVRDHINLMGVNPLRGQYRSGEERFVDLTQTYDLQMTRLLEQAGKATAVPVRSGVYLAVSGPSYETPAEIRAFARLGADAVGMSTVPEAIVARQCGLRVAALSCITNLAARSGQEPLSHLAVLASAERVKRRASALLSAFAGLYAQNISG